MAVSQISVFVENKQGALVDITDTLAKHNVNIMSLCDNNLYDIGSILVV